MEEAHLWQRILKTERMYFYIRAGENVLSIVYTLEVSFPLYLFCSSIRDMNFSKNRSKREFFIRKIAEGPGKGYWSTSPETPQCLSRCREQPASRIMQSSNRISNNQKRREDEKVLSS